MLASTPAWLLAGLGGFLGSVGRYALSGAVQSMLPASRFPWGTLAVNVAGCFAIGILGGLAEHRALLTAEARVFLMIGLLGGFTTFSSFGFETLALLRDGQFLGASSNVIAQMLLCLLAAWLGLAITRY